VDFRRKRVKIDLRFLKVLLALSPYGARLATCFARPHALCFGWSLAAVLVFSGGKSDRRKSLKQAK
jgi:hypothetical protein